MTTMLRFNYKWDTDLTKPEMIHMNFDSFLGEITSALCVHYEFIMDT